MICTTTLARTGTHDMGRVALVRWQRSVRARRGGLIATASSKAKG